MFACRECRLRRPLQLQEKLLKGGESRIQAVLPIFVGYALVLYTLKDSEGVKRLGTHQLQ